MNYTARLCGLFCLKRNNLCHHLILFLKSTWKKYATPLKTQAVSYQRVSTFAVLTRALSTKIKTVVMKAEAEFQLQQMESMFRTAMSKRNVDTSSMDVKPYDAHGKTYRQTITFKEGIEQPMAKKIVKLVKDAKIKVQTAIQGEELRVTGKKA